MQLTESQHAFILHWGEMGSSWGINRAVAQVHALLLVTENPLHAQEISETLSIARSNVSTSLKELQGWDLIKLTHVMGDRREHFDADKDVWRVLTKIANKRIQHEILPTISILKGLEQNRTATVAQKKLFSEFAEALEGGVSFYRRVASLPIILVRRLLKLENKLERLLDKRSTSDA